MGFGIMDALTEGQRQLERAARLLDVAGPQGTKTPVHRALEQLFCEARTRSQPHGSLAAAAPYGAVGTSRLLQGTSAQRLAREVTDFCLSSSGGGSAGSSGGIVGAAGATSLGLTTAPEDQPHLGVREFFSLRRERLLMETVEEAHRDCMRGFERHAFEQVEKDWDDTKAQIMGLAAPNCDDLGVLTMSPPPQDAAIIDALLAEAGVSRPLVRNISALSCESCPPYREELVECWRIVGYELQSTPRAVTCGALRYLQDKYAEDIKEAVYRSADAQLGGVPDAWAIVCGYGRVKFETDDFPSCAAHVWFAAYVATRAGIAHLLVELPDRGAPCSDRCPALRTVCALMARRLQAVAAAAPNSAGQQSQDFAMGGDADPADLLRADLAETGGSPFHDILLALLLGRRFGLGGLPEGTVEDWIWFRLHALQIGAGDINQAPEFAQQLEALRQHTLTLRPSHYDPMGSGAAPPSGFGAPGEQPLPAMGVHSYGAAQTLNSVKVLLLTGQFGRAVQELRAQDRCLWGPALHIALVLHRAGALGALAGSGPPTNVAGLVCDYACRFGCGDQLRYLRALDPADRVQALQRLLLRGDIGTSDELLGFIDANGQHHPGLLELTLHEDGLGGQPEFVKLCADTGSAAYEHGQYREALRLFHLGRCHTEVLRVLSRCLRLPMWRDPAAAGSEEAERLSSDIDRFFGIYERNLDRYALSSQSWAIARKLYAARLFHVLCDRGRPEAALDLFEREQLLPLGSEDGPQDTEADSEVLAEYPRIVGDYVRALWHMASQGAIPEVVLRARTKQLQAFLALHLSCCVVLDQQTAAALARLAMC